MAVSQVRLPDTAELTGDESMAATNTITDESGSMALPGSASESTTGKPVGDPLPGIPGDQRPVGPSGEHGSAGLPHPPSKTGGGFTVGVQPGGNQGRGGGAGSSGPDLWKPTESSS